MKRVMWSLKVLLVGGLLIASGCGTATVEETAPAEEEPSVDFTAFDSRAEELIGQMTLEEKIGQMTQADQEFLSDISDISDLALGSLLSGGNSDPEAGNSFEDWRSMYDRYQNQALQSRLGIPLLYGVDAVHGHSNVLGAVIFPHNIGLGATRNPDLVQEINRITALEVRATGINWNFAPCVTVPRDDRWGRTYEGFSEDPQLVRELGGAAVRGLQGEELSAPTRVLACAKHYLGDGGTAWETGTVGRGEDDFWPLDRGDTVMEESELRRIHLAGYLSALEEDVGSIMPSYSSWNGQKLSGHRYLLTDVLKEELNFQGFLISDYNAIEELPGDYRDQVKQSINAGMDMMMVPERYREFISTLQDLVEGGEVPMSRIDDAVLRILRVKYAMGLFEGSPLSDPALAEDFGSDAHRAVARQAVRESVVLLKNDAEALPMARTASRIHVAGRGADDLGMQCGGWTIEWQGARGNVTEGTTILEALQDAVSSETEITFDASGSGAAGADAAVVVIGESPYAEFMGDTPDLSLIDEDVETVQQVSATGVPTIVVFLSGRPLVIEEILDDADAILAAWLPGTEGLGVADVLLGDYAPTGKLSFTWPRSTDQQPINLGDADYDPLYPFGYGLSYE